MPKSGPLTGKTLNNAWVLGPLLGSGACCSGVYAGCPASSSSSSSGRSFDEWVVKVSPPLDPPPPPGAAKRKKSANQKCADALFHEYTIYNAHVLKLRSMGRVPDLPPGGRGYGECKASNVRYLVISRLHGYCDWGSESTPPSLSSTFRTAAETLETLRLLHECRLVFCDVKPQNIMVPDGPGPGGVGALPRLLDFGLASLYVQPSGKHRPNEPSGGAVQGTPQYCSIHVHGGETPSRRDDVEGLAYVLLERVLKSLCGREAADVLPWAGATSDKDGREKKVRGREALIAKARGASTSPKKRGRETSPTSRTKREPFDEFMEDEAVRRVRDFLRMAAALEYDGKPDYDGMRKILLAGESAGGASAARGRVSTQEKAPRSGKKSAVEEHDDDDDDDDDKPVATKASSSASSKLSPKKTKKATEEEVDSGRKKAPAKKKTPPKSKKTAEVVDLVSSEDEEEDEEEEEEEEEDDDDNVDEGVGKGESEPAIVLEVSEGPHRGETFVLPSSSTGDTFTIGRGADKKGKVDWSLGKSKEASACHCSVTICGTGAAISLRVRDLSSSNGTFINGRRLEPSKGSTGGMQVFEGGVIRLGDEITLKVKKTR